jgi:pimeloyl-ACP methyl ester carboxylesterase
MFSVESLRSDQFSWNAALSLAVASNLAYERQDILESVVTQSWGFDNHTAFDRGDTQGFVACSPDVILIAFRGTESVGDWIGNLDVFPTLRSYGFVHSGFLSAYLLVEPDIRRALASAAPTQGTKIWLTGHSLGGALAAIAAAELQSSCAVTGIHTYGQPRTGNSQLRDFIATHYKDRFFRFVNDDDVVTRVPPGYQHLGKLIHFDASGNLHRPGTEAEAATVESPPMTEEEYRELQIKVQRAKAKLRAQEGAEIADVVPSEKALRGLTPEEVAELPLRARRAALDASVEGQVLGFSDHSLARYIALIQRMVTGATLDAGIGIGLERSSRSAMGAFESASGRKAR